MNLALTGSLLGLGYALSNDQDETSSRRPFTEEEAESSSSSRLQKRTNRGGSMRVDSIPSVYSQNISRHSNSYERQVVETSFEKMKTPEESNIIPPFYNRQVFNDNSSSVSGVPQRTSSTSTVYSLTGKTIPVSEFTHNNMVPFFGGHIRQNVNVESTRSIMENFQGSEPVYWKEKQEQKPLFKQQKNVSFVHGTPSHASSITERYIPSNFRQGEFPFQPQHIGPGLGLTPDAPPTGGFQQDIRRYELPKSVDELRQGSNPKITYEGRTKPGKTLVTNRSEPSEMAKRTSDSFFENSPERYLTTVGNEKEQTYRSEIVEKFTNRLTTSDNEYTGSAAPSQTKLSDLRVQEYNTPFKDTTVLGANGQRNLILSTVKGVNDYGKDSIALEVTRRNETEDNTYLSNVNSIFHAMIAPLQDFLKHTKNEELVEKERATQGVVVAAVKSGVVHDPLDIARTTIKETSVDNNHEGFYGGLRTASIVYDADNDIARVTIRETTSQEHTGNISSNQKGNIVKDPLDVARTTVKETLVQEARLGNVEAGGKEQIIVHADDVARTTMKQTLEDSKDKYVRNIGFQEMTNAFIYDPLDIPKTTIKELDVSKTTLSNAFNNQNSGYLVKEVQATNTSRQFSGNTNYIGGKDRQTSSTGAYNSTEYMDIPTQRQSTSHTNYSGTAKVATGGKPVSIDNYLNAEISSKHEDLEEGRDPTASGQKEFVGKESVMSMEHSKTEVEDSRKYSTTRTSTIYQPVTEDSITRVPIENKLEVSQERNAPEILSAYKENPYTQSLNSVA
jgi:hypothetical protein